MEFEFGSVLDWKMSGWPVVKCVVGYLPVHLLVLGLGAGLGGDSGFHKVLVVVPALGLSTLGLSIGSSVHVDHQPFHFHFHFTFWVCLRGGVSSPGAAEDI